MGLIHADDLLVKTEFVTTQGFTPFLQLWSLSDTITQVVSNIQNTLRNNLELRCDLSSFNRSNSLMVFDRRKLQLMLLTLISYSIQDQNDGFILISAMIL